jgi:hypothetical protein
MSDFSEIENDLRKLRPAQPSPILFQRIEEGLAGCRASVSDANWKRWRRFAQTPYNWAWASGLAAAAVLVLFAAISMQRGQERAKEVAQNSQLSKAVPSVNNLERAIASEKLIPAGGTRVVYTTRDEGLHFMDASHQPLRRVRYETRQTWRWRNPITGASLRVSYPSEEVVLIPVSGQ